MTRFSIKVISDTVCPWCYLGKRRLEAGIAAYRRAHPNTDDTFSIEWLPFYLNPAAPIAGMDRAARWRKVYGDAGAEERWSTIRHAGKEFGINFKFSGRTGHTRDSHRLIKYARRIGGDEMQSRVVNELFRDYFENEGDITSRSMLTDAAAQAGLDKDSVMAYLDSEEDRADIDKEAMEARSNGVHGVPNITINGLVQLPGAVDAVVYRQVFEKVKDVVDARDQDISLSI